MRTSPDPAPEPPFEIVRQAHHSHVRLVCSGGLDLDSRRTFLASVEQALTFPTPKLLVDVADLTYCDSAGLQALVTAARRSADADTEMRIVGVRGAVQRLFELVDLAHIIPVDEAVETVDEGVDVNDFDETSGANREAHVDG